MPAPLNPSTLNPETTRSPRPRSALLGLLGAASLSLLLPLGCSAEPAPPVDEGPAPTPTHVEAEPAPSRVDRPPPRIERDPYASYLDQAEAIPDGARTKLERIPLDRLRVVGTALSAAPLALVEDGSGEGHVVRIGTGIGTAGGRVKSISADRLVVEERMRDHSGRVLRLHKELKLSGARG
jgi:Tfp pilus assembly protein PilP